MSDLIEVACQCGRVFRAKPEHAGRKGRCRACGVELRIPEMEKASVFVPLVKDEPIAVVKATQGRLGILCLLTCVSAALCLYLLLRPPDSLKNKQETVVVKETERIQPIKRADQVLGVKTFVSIEIEPGKVAKVPGGEVMLLLSAVERGRLGKAVQALVDATKQALHECSVKSDTYDSLITLSTEAMRMWNLAPDEFIDTHSFYMVSRACLLATKKTWEDDRAWPEYMKRSFAYPLDRSRDGGYEIKPIHEGKYFLYAFHNSNVASIEWYAVCEIEGDSVLPFDLSTKDVGFYSVKRR